MASSPKGSKRKSLATDVEFFADSWSRFERAVDVVAKSPPQHRTKLGKPRGKPGKNAAKRRAAPKPRIGGN
jgi:hypothetical protein